MRIYEIKYRCFVVASEEEKEEYDLDDNAIREEQDCFHLGADNLVEAVSLSLDHLDEIFGDAHYDIISTTELPGVDVVNWPGEEENDCPICRAENAAPDDVLTFQCSCGAEIKIMSEGWEIAHCHDCSREICRDRIIGSNGHYILLDIDKE